MSVENLVNKALGRIGNVHPVVKQGAEEIVKRAYKQNIFVLFSDGYRSIAEQNELYAQGRTKPGKIVTNARGGQSLHNYGLALDMFITNKEGTTATWPVNKLRQVAQIAKSLGFEWGGDWTNFKDYPHIQMTGGLTLAQLQAGKKPNISLKNVSGTNTSFTPNTSTTSTLRKGDSGSAVKKLQQDLIKLGYYLGKYGADGSFGADTDKAVRKLQKDHKLTVDGIVGEQTINKIKDLLKGELSVSAEKKLQKQIDELKKQLKDKLDKPSNKQTPDDSHIIGTNFAIDKGLTDGKNPYSPVSRQQLNTIIYRLHKKFLKLDKSISEEITEHFDLIEDYLKDPERWKQKLENNEIELNELLGMFMLVFLRQQERKK